MFGGKCPQCGRTGRIWAACVAVVICSIVVFLLLQITSCVRQDRAARQSTIESRQSAIENMPQGWETWYVILQKIELPQRATVFAEFLSREPDYFEGQKMTPEQWGIFIELFPQSTYVDSNIVTVLTYIKSAQLP